MVLRYIFWDQLSEDLASLKEVGQDDIILLCELKESATYVAHHKKKLVFLWSAMRHFANTLIEKGYKVIYVKVDDKNNTQVLDKELKRHIKQYNIDQLIFTHPSEYHQLSIIENLQQSLTQEVIILQDDRFLCSQQTFKDWAGDKAHLRMEFFYREMRKQYGILMQGNQPEGGKWNYDAENRKPPKTGLKIPKPYHSAKDPIVEEVKQLVAQHFNNHFGDIEPFYFAVTRQQALRSLEKFISERLIHFGTYQDAMIQGEPWMYHAHISFYINSGLLSPLECIHKAEQAYQSNQAPLNAVEGFIRQILGWREFIRGIYWLKMPQYAEVNFLKAKRPLPTFFWNGNTDMNCVHQVVTETKENAYAHHIQRLMVIGNFALIAGLDPKDVNEWFWIVYADAYQWVELPNVTGMALFADGGVLGSKPYAASGQYINKMSDYCKGCRYKVTEKVGEEACPFNYLYWDFLIRNQRQLGNNQRLGFMYGMINKMTDDKIHAIQSSAKQFLSTYDK
ncbi:MAG: cryptochrome/photolyase family protein [Pseudomonadota bacterium]|nr:cryptochrome/photolyase family protein [Pseudomonadota bacterium]